MVIIATIGIVAAPAAANQLVLGLMIEVHIYDMSVFELEGPNGTEKINTSEAAIEVLFRDTVKNINVQEYNQCVKEEKEFP